MCVMSSLYFSARANAFVAKDSVQLAEWLKGIGLDMYCDLVQEKMLTGEALAEMVAEDNLVVRISPTV